MLFNKNKRELKNICASNEIRRLQLLENAVINYGGGLLQLELRAANQATILRQREPETAELLDDIALYLHDVAATGRLDIYNRKYSL